MIQTKIRLYIFEIWSKPDCFDLCFVKLYYIKYLNETETIDGSYGMLMEQQKYIIFLVTAVTKAALYLWTLL